MLFRGGIRLNGFLTGLNWYVWEQLLFYLVYWLACKVVPAYVELSVGIFSVLFIFLAYAIGMENPWYGSSLCFALGLYYYQYEKKRYIKSASVDNEIVHKRIDSSLLLLVLLAITGGAIILFYLIGNDSILGNPIARNIASVSFGIAAIILLYKLKIGNKASRSLGEFSYEIFLVHPYMLTVLSGISEKSKVLYGVLTVILSIFSAYLIHLLIGWIFKVFNILQCIYKRQI